MMAQKQNLLFNQHIKCRLEWRSANRPADGREKYFHLLDYQVYCLNLATKQNLFRLTIHSRFRLSLSSVKDRPVWIG